MKPRNSACIALLGLAALLHSPAAQEDSVGLGQVKIANGTLDGVDRADGVTVFLGIPYALPPVGDLRWREPQPSANWPGVRRADHFGPHAPQRFMATDMILRSPMSEDCLYLNVWTSAKAPGERMPVLVYFHGGGFIAGSGDEPRYDGANMSRRGIVVVTVNYRLGIFGFFALPELTRESPHHASGNYGFLDQCAALRWVRDNIGAFGGDPAKVTIGGQSAGASSASAHMVSPLSRGLFRGVIAESGSILGGGSRDDPGSLADAEDLGARFAASVHADSPAALRAVPAEKLFEATGNPEFSKAHTIIDGYFLTESPREVFFTGRQADVPLLVGSTSAEQDYHSILGADEPTRENYAKALRRILGGNADQALSLYPPDSNGDARIAATQLATDRSAGFRCWQLGDIHSKSGGKPVFDFIWAQPLPPPRITDPRKREPAMGAPHSSELSYLFGNMDIVDTYYWTPTDRKASRVIQAFFANFVKTGNPNGAGLPAWPWVQASIPKVMVLAAEPHAEEESRLKRFDFWESIGK